MKLCYRSHLENSRLGTYRFQSPNGLFACQYRHSQFYKQKLKILGLYSCIYSVCIFSGEEMPIILDIQIFNLSFFFPAIDSLYHIILVI